MTGGSEHGLFTSQGSADKSGRQAGLEVPGYNCLQKKASLNTSRVLKFPYMKL